MYYCSIAAVVNIGSDIILPDNNRKSNPKNPRQGLDNLSPQPSIYLSRPPYGIILKHFVYYAPANKGRMNSHTFEKSLKG